MADEPRLATSGVQSGVWQPERARMFNSGAIPLVLIRDIALPFLAYRLLTGGGVPIASALVVAALIPTLGVACTWTSAIRHGAGADSRCDRHTNVSQ